MIVTCFHLFEKYIRNSKFYFSVRRIIKGARLLLLVRVGIKDFGDEVTDKRGDFLKDFHANVVFTGGVIYRHMNHCNVGELF